MNALLRRQVIELLCCRPKIAESAGDNKRLGRLSSYAYCTVTGFLHNSTPGVQFGPRIWSEDPGDPTMVGSPECVNY